MIIEYLKNNPFFEDLSHEELDQVSKVCSLESFSRGDQVFSEGAPGDKFYIIVSGKVAVEANGNQVGSLANGECFGETSYVRGAKRQASIKADGAVTILRVSSTLMEQVSSACQLRFNKVFLRSLIQRLQGTT